MTDNSDDYMTMKEIDALAYKAQESRRLEQARLDRGASLQEIWADSKRLATKVATSAFKRWQHYWADRQAESKIAESKLFSDFSKRRLGAQPVLPSQPKRYVDFALELCRKVLGKHKDDSLCCRRSS